MSRFKCNECGALRGCAEYPDGTYCHSCSAKEFNVKLVSWGSEVLQTSTIDPEQPRSDWPQEAIQYLRNFYIKDEQIKFHDIYYSKLQRRIMFPNNSAYPTCAWGRSLTDKTKWLKYGDRNALYIPYRTRKTEELILVEDVISAIRVSRFKDTLCLCGTALKNTMYSLTLQYKSIIIWLDGDIAGVRGAEKIKRELKLYKNIRIITTKQDPKMFTDKQIEEILRYLTQH